MYKIIADNNLIYDPTADQLQMLSAVLTKEDNVADNFTFQPSITNIAAQNLEELTTFIEVFDNEERLFRGRILNLEQDINNIYSYVCEGEFAFLADSVVRPYTWNADAIGELEEQREYLYSEQRRFDTLFDILEDDLQSGAITQEEYDIEYTKLTDNKNAVIKDINLINEQISLIRSGAGIESYLKFLIASHNSQVDPKMQFVVRNVTVVDPNDYIVRASEQYPTTLEEIKLKLTDKLVGHFYLERIDNITYIDYLADSPHLSNQTIELGKNIIDLKKYAKAENLATALIPLGAQIEDKEGNKSGRLTIKSVNNGVDYIRDAVAVAKYGYIIKTVIYDDITIASNLLKKGQEDLTKLINPIDSFEVNAVDLVNTGADVDSIRFLDKVKIWSNPHGIEGTLLITKISINLLNPANNMITIGSNFGTFTKSSSSFEQRINYYSN